MIHCRWPGPLLLAVVCWVCGFAILAIVRTPPARAATDGLQSSVDYLLHAQNSDGGFGGQPGQASSPLFAGWAALGLESAGVRLQTVDRGPGLIAYIESQAGAADAGSIERNILVARAAGLSPSDFGGHHLVAMLRAKFSGDGSVGGEVNLTAFGILALRAAGLAVPARTSAWLQSQQDADGGFGFAGRGSASDVDDTGAVLEALKSAPGARATAVRTRAITYVRRQQDRDGGFPSQPGEGSNAQSTAWAMQGLDAAGVDPSGLHHAGGPSPLGYLQSLIAGSGAIAYARGQDETPVWVTGEALMALAGKPLPLAPLPARAHTSTSTATAPAPVTRVRTSTTRSSSTSASTGAPHRVARRHGRPAGRSSPQRSVRAPARAPDARVQAPELLGAVAQTGTLTLAAIRALM